jgi:alanine transaminase
VYQHNVYAKGSEFHSFHKVLAGLGADYADQELASFMSISKGYMGECGYRGGYCELLNVDPEVKAMLIKSISASLCSSVLAQVRYNYYYFYFDSVCVCDVSYILF